MEMDTTTTQTYNTSSIPNNIHPYHPCYLHVFTMYLPTFGGSFMAFMWGKYTVGLMDSLWVTSWESPTMVIHRQILGDSNGRLHVKNLWSKEIDDPIALSNGVTWMS